MHHMRKNWGTAWLCTHGKAHLATWGKLKQKPLEENIQTRRPHAQVQEMRIKTLLRPEKQHTKIIPKNTIEDEHETPIIQKQTPSQRTIWEQLDFVRLNPASNHWQCNIDEYQRNNPIPRNLTKQNARNRTDKRHPISRTPLSCPYCDKIIIKWSTTTHRNSKW